MLPSSDLGLGPQEVGQKGLRLSTYDITHKNSKTKKFFSLQGQRLAKCFEGLNSSLVLMAPEILLRKDTCKLLFFC